MKTLIGMAIIATVNLMLPGAISQGQTPERPAPALRAVPRDLIYRILFREIASYQVQADELAKQSKPNGFIRNYHRDLFQLSPPHFAKVKSIALDCVQQLQVIDGQAKAIIEAAKSKHMGAPRDSPNAMVPPPPPELAILEERRKSLVLAAADSIAPEIGKGQMAYFETTARRYISSGLTGKSNAGKL